MELKIGKRVYIKDEYREQWNMPWKTFDVVTISALAIDDEGCFYIEEDDSEVMYDIDEIDEEKTSILGDDYHIRILKSEYEELLEYKSMCEDLCK